MRKAIFILSVLAVFIVSVSDISAQDRSEYEAKKNRLEKEIALLDKQLNDNASASRSELSRLTLFRSKVAGRRTLIAESDKQIRRYSDNIYLAQRQINRLNERLDTLSDYYARLIRGAYKNRDAKVWYMYILASENIGQAFRRYNYFKNLSGQMKIQADKIRQTEEELKAEKEKMTLLKADAEKVREERQKELASLEKEEQQAANSVAKLKRNRKKYEAELASKKRQVESLDREIKRIIREAMDASGKQTGKQVDYKLAEEFSKNKGKLPWPADGAVVDRFGQHYHPVFTRVKLPFNNGLSIAVAKGSSVNAVFNGVVKQIVVMPGYNQCVLVQHGNYFSFYCKLKSTSVKPGDKVTTGQKIGTVDTINGETQLHFQIWQNSTPQNPELWLRDK